MDSKEIAVHQRKNTQTNVGSSLLGQIVPPDGSNNVSQEEFRMDLEHKTSEMQSQEILRVEEGQVTNLNSSTTEIRHHRSSVEEIIMTSFHQNKSNFHQMH